MIIIHTGSIIQCFTHAHNFYICKNAKYSYKDLQSLPFKVKGNNGKTDSQKLLPTNNKFVVIFSLQPSVSLTSNQLVNVTILNM